jgi:GNAT superfamily N-acetyltransferase
MVVDKSQLRSKPLDQSKTPVAPDALTFVDRELRRAEPTDAIAVARVHVRSWQAAYRKLMPDEHLDQLRPEDRAKKYDFGNLDPLRPHTIVATESGDIRGFATTAQAQDSNMSDYGELCALYVDPDYWGRGIGVALWRQLVLGFLIGDFEVRFSGYSRATFGRSAFIGWISGPQMGYGEPTKCGV